MGDVEAPLERLDRAAADGLATQICAAAGRSAAAEAELIALIGRFDAGGGVGWMLGVKSLAHWLSYSCSMSPGTAREHVRVARALRRMPTVAAAFADARLSYSKVREVTRVVDEVDEARLCDLAMTATASQLARTVRSFRSCAGLRMAAQEQRSMTWTERDTGIIDFRVRLPKEEAAVLIAALNAATDQFAPPPAPPSPEQVVDPTPAYGHVDAILDVARGFLSCAPEDRSGEDRTLVVVQVAAEQLGLSEHGNDRVQPADVPAGTSVLAADPICHLQGLGGIAPDTARKLACDADVLAAITTGAGDVLNLGRAHRLVSKAQRRALMIRDQGSCQFPGCHSTRHLKVHHRIHWADGGPTDLDNLILLCQWHHTAVHEGGMSIHRAATATRAHRWQFVMPDGTPYRPLRTAGQLVGRLAPSRTELSALTNAVDSWTPPEPERIRPRWAGEPFDLAATVGVVFGMRTRPAA